MTCDELQLVLSTTPEPRSDDVEAHLQRCAACRAFAADARQVLALAALPELSAAEKAKVATLPVAVLGGWRASERRRGLRREVGRLAIAAGLGALVASAAWAWAGAGERAAIPPAAVAVVDDDPNLSDDEVFSEVSWNPEAEGALP